MSLDMLKLKRNTKPSSKSSAGFLCDPEKRKGFAFQAAFKNELIRLFQKREKEPKRA
jgi:hypothetical protein